MYVPQVLHPHPTERTVLAHKEQQSYGTMDNTSSQAEGIISYSAGPAVTEQATRSSVWMPRTNTRWSTCSRFRRTNSHRLLSILFYWHAPACWRGTELIPVRSAAVLGDWKADALGLTVFQAVCTHWETNLLNTGMLILRDFTYAISSLALWR